MESYMAKTASCRAIQGAFLVLYTRTLQEGAQKKALQQSFNTCVGV
jgi:hypothetical protein